jgi:hypothetical protein
VAIKHLGLPLPLPEEEVDWPASETFADGFWRSFDVIVRVALLLPADKGVNDTMMEQDSDGESEELHEFVNEKSDGFCPPTVTDWIIRSMAPEFVIVNVPAVFKSLKLSVKGLILIAGASTAACDSLL